MSTVLMACRNESIHIFTVFYSLAEKIFFFKWEIKTNGNIRSNSLSTCSPEKNLVVKTDYFIFIDEKFQFYSYGFFSIIIDIFFAVSEHNLIFLSYFHSILSLWFTQIGNKELRTSVNLKAIYRMRFKVTRILPLRPNFWNKSNFVT